MARGILDRAESFFGRGMYLEAVRLLEPMVVHYRDSARFYRVLGLSCLHANDPGGASTYLRRAQQLSPGDVDVRLALAVVDLRKRDVVSSVQAYLSVLEDDPKNRIAALGLEMIRGLKDDDAVSGLVDSERLKKLYPGKRAIPVRALGAAALAAAACCAVALLAFLLPKAIPPRARERPGMASLKLADGERDSPIGQATSASYILTEREALASYDRALKAFADYRDNLAVREANLILGSNASDYLKAKAKALKSYAKAPTFADIRDVPTFDDVIAKPALHEGCVVAWKGLAANLKPAGDSTALDFLVGYHDKKVLKGLIHAVAAADSGIGPDDPVELLAYVRLEPAGPWLEVISVHELSY